MSFFACFRLPDKILRTRTMVKNDTMAGAVNNECDVAKSQQKQQQEQNTMMMNNLPRPPHPLMVMQHSPQYPHNISPLLHSGSPFPTWPRSPG